MERRAGVGQRTWMRRAGLTLAVPARAGDRYRLTVRVTRRSGVGKQYSTLLRARGVSDRGMNFDQCGHAWRGQWRTNGDRR